MGKFVLHILRQPMASLFLFTLVASTFYNTAMAQDETQSDDNYDPFSDYSEFTEASTEEGDLNFFRNGRLLSIGLSAGVTTFTGGYSELYSIAPAFGANLTYFFDMQFAVQTGFKTSDHDFSFQDSDGKNYNFKMRLFDIHLYGKYFFNTQNMTRAFAEWNPFLIGGVSFIQRSHSNAVVVRSSDNAQSFDIGGGFEYIYNKKRNYFGFILIYQYTTFAGEGLFLPDPLAAGDGLLDVKQEGDPITLMGTIGINF